MNFIKIASSRFLRKVNLNGKFGPFMAYVVSGDTYPIKTVLSQLGFSWMGSEKVWYISENNFTSSILPRLSNVGVDTSAVSLVQSPTNPANPENPSANIEEPIKPTTKQWVTENQEMTKWYGFPINKNILQYKIDFTIDGEQHTENISIDRWYKLSSSQYGKDTKSREHKGFPLYVITIYNDENTILGTMRILCSKKWGTYNEEEYLKDLQNTIKVKLENNPPQKTMSQAHASLLWKYDFNKRTPELIEELKKIMQDNYTTKHEVTIENTTNPEYNGKYLISLKSYKDKPEDIAEIYMYTNISLPNAPSSTMLGSVNLYKVHTIEELNARIQEYVSKDQIQTRYLEYLKSFAFLQSEQDKDKLSFDFILSLLSSPDSATDSILRKIQEKGYIRPHKRQKQNIGISFGDEIKWIVDSKKIINDIYSNRTLHNSPDYFYTVIAYYIHRKIRNIWSWSDMMLTDSISIWLSRMKKYGATFDKDIYDIISSIGNKIIYKLFGDIDNKKSNFNDFFNDYSDKSKTTSTSSNYLEQFKNIAEQYGVDTTNLENNLKNVYRQLVTKIHPDKFVEEDKKIEMTRKFQELQNLWEEIETIYKVSYTWYDSFLFKKS